MKCYSHKINSLDVPCLILQSLSSSSSYSEARKCVLMLQRPTTAVLGTISDSECEMILYQTNISLTVMCNFVKCVMSLHLNKNKGIILKWILITGWENFVKVSYGKFSPV